MNFPELPKPDFAAPTVYEYTAEQMLAYGSAIKEWAANKCGQLPTPDMLGDWGDGYFQAKQDCAAAIREGKQ